MKRLVLAACSLLLAGNLLAAENPHVLLNTTGTTGSLSFAQGPALADGPLWWGGTLGDLDNDGDVDAFIGAGGNEDLDWDALLQNRIVEDGAFAMVDVAAAAGVAGVSPDQAWSSASARTVDFDNDGQLDVWVNSYLLPAGKLPVTHMDGILRQIAEDIGRTGLPVIEAFTPPPDGNLSVADARRLWPDKALWLNFPSSVHLSPPEEIKRVTAELVAQAGDGHGFAIGVTENSPATVGARSLHAIGEALA